MSYKNIFTQAKASVARQDTEPWKRIRGGKFTGSNYWKLLPNKEGKWSEVGLTYIGERLNQRLSGTWDREIFTEDILWGKENEPKAKVALEKREGVEIIPSYFIPFGETAGATADGWFNDSTFIEIKCPRNGLIHIENLEIEDQLTFKQKRLHHFAQIQFNMMCSPNAKKCLFTSFDPRTHDYLQLYTLVITRDEPFIQDIKDRLVLAERELQARLTRIKKRFEK